MTAHDLNFAIGGPLSENAQGSDIAGLPTIEM
jgi:hypothetical protein